MILVTGGTGVMGRVLVRRLLNDGHRIRLLTLPGDTGREAFTHEGIEWWTGDISDPDSLRGICEKIDTVVHCAAIILTSNKQSFKRINVDGTRNLLDEARKVSVNHLICISSASVVYPESTPYSRSKREAEKLIRQSGLPYTILRPTLIINESGGEEFNRFLRYLKMFPVIPFIGSGDAIKRPVHADAVTDGIYGCVGNRRAINGEFNLSGDERITIKGFAHLCLSLMHQSKPIVSLPVWLCRALAGVLEPVVPGIPLNWQTIAGIIQDADIDNRGAKEVLGFTPGDFYADIRRCFPRKI